MATTEPVLTEEDLKFKADAEKFKAEGVQHFSSNDLEKSETSMIQALGEIEKCKNRNTEVKTLQGFICQNLALIHKLNTDLVNSMKMSEKALESDPSNWKALLNKADITQKLAKAASQQEATDEKKYGVEECQKALEDIKKARESEKSDPKQIDVIERDINCKIAQLTPDKDTAIAALDRAIELKEDAPTLFTRFRIQMAREKWNLAVIDGEKILEIDPQFMMGQFRSKWLRMAKYKVRKVPITVLTGFLGSGKTTLLNRILKENHGKKIAVIENEFGAVGIDDKLVEMKQYQDEAIIEIMNGCICCTVREDLITTILEMKKKYYDTDKIDYIIIETTGMADPAPVIQTFLLNDEIQDWCKIDACLTICDASQIVLRLEEDREEGCENEAVEQVCFADKIFLNKVDLCNREQLDAATTKIKEYNTQATIEESQFNNSDIPFSQLLDLDAFSIKRALEIDSELLTNADAEHKHDSRIGTFSYKMEAEMTMKGANEFLSSVLMEKGANIYRMKGFLAIEGSEEKFVFHSVGMLTSCTPYTPWEEGEKRECIFVIIGKHLEQKWLEDKFRAAAINAPEVVETIRNEALEKAQAKNNDGDSNLDGKEQ